MLSTCVILATIIGMHVVKLVGLALPYPHRVLMGAMVSVGSVVIASCQGQCTVVSTQTAPYYFACTLPAMCQGGKLEREETMEGWTFNVSTSEWAPVRYSAGPQPPVSAGEAIMSRLYGLSGPSGAERAPERLSPNSPLGRRETTETPLVHLMGRPL